MGHELYCAGHLIQAAIAFARATGDETAAHGRPPLRRPDRRGVRRRAPDAGPTGIPRSRWRSSSCTGRPASGATSSSPPRSSTVAGHGLFAGGRFELDLLPGCRARPRVAHDRRPRRARALPRRRRRPISTPRPATSSCWTRCCAQWDDVVAAQDVPHRRRRLAPLRRGDRRPLRAAARPRLLRDVRGDREHHVELADAARDRREPRFADLIERTLYNGFLSGLSLDGRDVLLRQPAAVARRRTRRAALVPGRLLPAEHHAPARIARSLPRDDRATRACRCTSTHRRASARRRRAATRSSCASRPTTRGPARVDIEVVAGGSDEWTLSLRIPAWSREARVDGERVAPGTYAQLTRRWRPGDRVVARARRGAPADRSQPAHRRGSRVPRRRARAARVLLRGARPARRRRSRRRAARRGSRPRGGGAAARRSLPSPG